MKNIYRLGTVLSLAVNSAAGAAVSTANFESQTRVIQLNFPGSASSTGGVRISIAEAPAADSTAALISPNWPVQFIVTPGQRLSAISNDAGTPTLNIIQLTK